MVFVLTNAKVFCYGLDVARLLFTYLFINASYIHSETVVIGVILPRNRELHDYTVYAFAPFSNS